MTREEEVAAINAAIEQRNAEICRRGASGERWGSIGQSCRLSGVHVRSLFYANATFEQRASRTRSGAPTAEYVRESRSVPLAPSIPTVSQPPQPVPHFEDDPRAAADLGSTTMPRGRDLSLWGGSASSLA